MLCVVGVIMVVAVVGVVVMVMYMLLVVVVVIVVMCVCVVCVVVALLLCRVGATIAFIALVVARAAQQPHATCDIVGRVVDAPWPRCGVANHIKQCIDNNLIILLLGVRICVV